MAEEKKSTRGRKKKDPTAVDKKTRKQIVSEEINKIEKVAEKIALKTMTEMQLATQAPLSDDQKEGAKLIASGYDYDEVASRLGKKRQEVVAWMGQPSFTRVVNELTIKEGLSDKNERIRKTKRIAEELTNAMLEKLANGDAGDMPLSTLSKLAMEWSGRIDNLVDKKEETSKKDLTVLILNHVQSTNGKKYDKLDDFLSDDEFAFPTIDVQADTINE